MDERHAKAYEEIKIKQVGFIERKEKVEDVLDRLGIPRHKPGYPILRDSILYVMVQPKKIESMKRNVFPVVAPDKKVKEAYEDCMNSMRYIVKSTNSLGRNAYARVTGEMISAENFPSVKEFVSAVINYLN